MKTLRVGVIGCGEIAQIMHLPFLQELDEYKIAAICDVSRNVLDKVGEKFGVEHRYLSHKDMLDEVELDVVAILTMDHTQVAIDAAESRMHLFVEKPLAFSVSDAETICRAAEANQVKLMVGYMKLFDPGYLHAVEHFQHMEDVRFIRVQDFTGRWDTHRSLYSLVQATDLSAEMRETQQARLRLIIQEAIGSTDARLERLYSMLLMLCSHDFAVLRGAFGTPTRVVAVNAPESDFLSATLGYDDGKVVQFEVGTWTKYAWFQEEITAYGRDEIVACHFPNPYVRYLPTQVRVKSQESDKPVELVWSPSNEEAFRNEWLHFHDCIVNDKALRSTGRDAIQDLQLALAIIARLETSHA